MVFDSFLLTRTIVAFINVLGLSLIFLVYSTDPKAKLTKYFTLMTVLMFVWVDFAYLARISGQVDMALLWIKIAWSISPFLFILVYYFASSFTGQEKKYKYLNELLFVFGLIFVLITLFTSTIIKDIMFDEGGVLRIIYGEMVFLFFGAVFICSILSFLSLIGKYIKTNDLTLKREIKYLLFGLTFFILMNTIFNIVYPVFFNVVHLYYFGDYSTIIFLSLIAYTIVRYKLFNVRIFVVELLTFAIWFITAIEFFLAPTWIERFYKLVIFILALIVGISLIRSSKKEIEQREKLEKLTKQLKVANTRLKKLDEAKSEFISIASHQLRTPLTVIKGYLSMIREGDFGKLGEKIEGPIEKIYESSQRLISLVANLLNISRIESGKLKFNFVEMQLEDMIESVMEELKNKADEKGLRFTFKKNKKPLPKIKIDEEKIRQVVANLIDNSIKYTETGSIEIELKQENKDLYFCVKDTGAGIRKNDIGKLFQKFSRGTGKTKTTDGTGLGLFVARQMVEAHKGAIWVESKGEGHGSKFCFTLPIGKNTDRHRL